MTWVRVASVPLNGGREEAVVTIVPRSGRRDHPGVRREEPPSVEVHLRGAMTPREARMLAAALVAASREAEDS